jgi:deoxyribodipyrimidine photo-lyase
MNTIVWFRKNLRIKDNQCLIDGTHDGKKAMPLYIFDPIYWKGVTSYGFRQTGVFKAKFTLEALHDLSKSLATYHANLVIRQGNPEEVLYQLCSIYKINKVYFQTENSYDELKQEQSIVKKLAEIGVECVIYDEFTLIEKKNLPFPIKQLPEPFTKFRKIIEKELLVTPEVNKPLKINMLTPDFNEKIPSLNDLGFSPPKKDDRAVMAFEGGETAAWQRLDYYFWKQMHLKDYKEKRNGLVGSDYSSKLSPWLSIGCISPKSIYWQIKKFESEIIANDSTYWLFFELLWRDYFQFNSYKYQQNIFKATGNKISNETTEADYNESQLKNWIEGHTEEPFINANMNELNHTGFMSNRGRQNVASYLINDLKLPWIAGAEYFESMLIDYDPCSNYGNWSYLAGVGLDPRDNRYFNIPKQQKTYDPQGEYLKLWERQ